MRALSLDKSNGEGTRSDEDALENQSIRGMVYIITLSLSFSVSLLSLFLCAYVTFFCALQLDTKRGIITNLEHNLEESKKRGAHQLDEINRLEDQVRELNIELTSVQSQVEKLQHSVSGLVHLLIY